MQESHPAISSKKFRYATGMYVKSTALRTVEGNEIEIPSGEGLIHLQFRRFAGCPVCNLHLQSFVRHQDEVRQAGIREIIVFHSSREDILKYASGFPFELIADPGKQLYRDFGVERGMLALLYPRSVIAIIKGVVNSFLEFLQRKRPLPPLRPEGGSLGLPADFLIAPDGKIRACHYGQHADDHWSVGELLQLALSSKRAVDQPLR